MSVYSIPLSLLANISSYKWNCLGLYLFMLIPYFVFNCNSLNKLYFDNYSVIVFHSLTQVAFVALIDMSNLQQVS